MRIKMKPKSLLTLFSATLCLSTAAHAVNPARVAGVYKLINEEFTQLKDHEIHCAASIELRATANSQLRIFYGLAGGSLITSAPEVSSGKASIEIDANQIVQRYDSGELHSIEEYEWKKNNLIITNDLWPFDFNPKFFFKRCTYALEKSTSWTAEWVCDHHHAGKMSTVTQNYKNLRDACNDPSNEFGRMGILSCEPEGVEEGSTISELRRVALCRKLRD